jgi:glycerol-3-phosphate dehydrogenase
VIAPVYDLAIVGGGINGVAIARDAAGRGMRVFLCEAGDLGGGASSASSKLVHGALHHLDGWRFGAMREAVVERRILLHAAPHLVRPLRIQIPHHERLWSPAAIRLGLAAFDRVARSGLLPSRRVDLEQEGRGALKQHFTLAHEYSECLVDDTRLVVANAIDARSRGAAIHTRVRCTVAEREGTRWRMALESTATGDLAVVHARGLVNATGSAVAEVNNHVVHSASRIGARLTKATCIVVRHQAGASSVGYALPAADGQIVYAVPWREGNLLVGPAMRDAPPAATNTVEGRDIAFLADVVGQYFHAPIAPSDVTFAFAALRALPGEGTGGRADCAVTVEAPPRSAPLVTVFGGSIGTHRRLAEGVVDRLGRFRRLAPGWTAGATLPGGGFPPDGLGDLARALRAAYPFVGEALAARLAAAYGTRATAILTGARQASDLGRCFGSDLTEAEVAFLKNEEWAATAEDVLWRRTKLGMVLPQAAAGALHAWLAANPRQAPPVA